jgi:hypothetical protein
LIHALTDAWNKQLKVKDLTDQLAKKEIDFDEFKERTGPLLTPPTDQALSFNQQLLGNPNPDQAFAPNMMGD